MIQVIFQVDSNGQYKGFLLKGHAGYAEHGQDIVCAAVSALSINTVNSIEQFTEDTIQVEVNELEGGYLSLTFTSPPGPESTLFIHSLKLGLEGIRDDNNTEYISVKTRRCKP